jgi:hypothetical protein
MADKGGSDLKERGRGTARAVTTGSAFDFPAVLMIADMLPVMICLLDPERRYRFVN